MFITDRRGFLMRLGAGLFGAGAAWAWSGRSHWLEALAADAPARLSFGALDPLVDLVQETPPERLLPLLVAKLRDGVPTRTLVAAAALANARAFGGENYDGYHAFMA